MLCGDQPGVNTICLSRDVASPELAASTSPKSCGVIVFAFRVKIYLLLLVSMAVSIVLLLLSRRDGNLEGQKEISSVLEPGDYPESQRPRLTLSSILSSAVLASRALLKLLTLLTIGSNTPALMLSLTSPFTRSRP